MKQSKNTKRALTASILSMIVCCAMLIGSTFAWFTDSVTSGNNKIVAGNLDVTMEWRDGKEDPSAAEGWKDASKEAIFNYDKWEPGYAEVRHVRIGNNGSLALKYQINIVANGEVSKLADVIDVYYIKGGQQIIDRTGLANETPIGTLAQILADPAVANGHISAGQADIATIALKMQESAGNEYQGLSIGTDFSIQLVATQYTEEEDGFDNQYDKDATIPSSGKVLVDALNNPDVKKVTVGESIILGEGAYVGSNGIQNLAVLTDKDIDFANQTLTRPMSGSGNGFMIGNDDTPVTVNVANGNFISDDGQRLIQVSAGSTVTFKDSKFTAAGGDKIVTLNLKPNDLTTTVVFENCEFDKAAVEIAGRSGGTSNVNVQFINCTFTGTTLEEVAPEHANNHKYGTYAGYYTTSQLIATNSYISGNVNFDDCQFNWNGPAALGKSKTSEVFENYGAVYTLKDCTVTVTNSNGQTKIFASENANKLKFEGTNTFYLDGVEVDYKGTAK